MYPNSAGSVGTVEDIEASLGGMGGLLGTLTARDYRMPIPRKRNRSLAHSRHEYHRPTSVRMYFAAMPDFEDHVETCCRALISPPG